MKVYATNTLADGGIKIRKVLGIFFFRPENSKKACAQKHSKIHNENEKRSNKKNSKYRSVDSGELK